MAKWMKLGIFAAVGILLLIFSKAGADGARDGIGFCLEVLIPSLFPFLIFSSVLMQTGLLIKSGKVADWIAGKLFRLPGSCLGVIIMGMVGGYPVGASGALELYRNGAISRRDAERLVCFCCCAGPSFLITAVGTVMLGSTRQGILLFVAQAAAVIVLGAIMSRLKLAPCCSDLELVRQVDRRKRSMPTDFSQSLVNGVRQAISGMAMICAMTVVFSVISAVLNSLGAPDVLASVFSHVGIPEDYTRSAVALLLEIVSGCRTAANHIPLEMIAFALGFGGLCVQLQVAALLSEDRLFKGKFLLFRIAQGFISADVTYLLLEVFPDVREVFLSTGGVLNGSFSGSVTQCCALIFMCVIFLCTLKNKSVEIRL